MQRRRHGKIRSSKSFRSNHPKSYKTNCASCGKEVIVLVPPPQDKKLLCMDCFKK